MSANPQAVAAQILAMRAQIQSLAQSLDALARMVVEQSAVPEGPQERRRPRYLGDDEPAPENGG